MFAWKEVPIGIIGLMFLHTDRWGGQVYTEHVKTEGSGEVSQW